MSILIYICFKSHYESNRHPLYENLKMFYLCWYSVNPICVSFKTILQILFCFCSIVTNNRDFAMLYMFSISGNSSTVLWKLNASNEYSYCVNHIRNELRSIISRFRCVWDKTNPWQR